jgi:hypothetical protein
VEPLSNTYSVNPLAAVTVPHDPGTDGGAPDGFVTGAGADEPPVAGGGGGVPVDVVAGAEGEADVVGGGAWAAGSPEQAARAGTARQAASNGRHVLVVVGWGTAILPPRRAGRAILAHRARAPWAGSPTGVPEITPAGWRPGPVAAD